MKQLFRSAGLFTIASIIIMVYSTACKKNTLADHYTELRNNVPEPYKAFVNPFGDGSTIGAAVNLANDIVILYDEAGTRYAWYQDKRIQGVFSIKDSTAPLGKCKPLDNIGAAVELPTSDKYNLVVLFDKAKSFTLFQYNKTQFDNSNTIPATINASYSSGSISISGLGGPFAATGYEAAVEYVRPYGNDTAWHVFEKGGIRYARYVNAKTAWGPVTNFTDWGGNNDLFSAVGAASLIKLNNTLYNIFISKDGSQMGAWHLEGNSSVFEGPWRIN